MTDIVPGETLEGYPPNAAIPDLVDMCDPGQVRPMWKPATAGLLRLPSGRIVRGRSLRCSPTVDEQLPGFGLYLLSTQPPPAPWPARWVRWPDFRLPSESSDARDAFGEAWRRASGDRVELACSGGRGRTGTALACIAILDGVPAPDAVVFVRRHYHPRAVETPWQRRYVRHFAGHDPQMPIAESYGTSATTRHEP